MNAELIGGLLLPKTKRQRNPKNYNNFAQQKNPRRYLAPQLGHVSYGDRLTAMQNFLPEFKDFLLSAGISPEIQRSMGFEFAIAVDPRWQTSACDNVSAKCTYIGGHFAVWSTGANEYHLFGDLSSGKYRSGVCRDPQEFGHKFALLVCEAERCKDLRWWHRVPERIDGLFQGVLTFVMCVSFVIAPQTDWEKLDYLAVFAALTVCSVLSYMSRVKECDSLIDGEINQQAIGFKGGR